MSGMHAERHPLQLYSTEAVLYWGLMNSQIGQSSGRCSKELYIPVLLLAGLRAFAEQHAELLEGDLATLCSPRLGASVAGMAILMKAAGYNYNPNRACCTIDPRKFERLAGSVPVLLGGVS